MVWRAAPARQAVRRWARAMLVCPSSRWRFSAVLRKVARTCGPEPARMRERSSLWVTSRMRWTRLSGSPGALLRRGPLRTVRATRRGTRLRQPQGGAGSAVVGMVLLRVVVRLAAQQVCTRRWVVGRLPGVGTLVGQDLAHRAVPLLPLAGGV